MEVDPRERLISLGVGLGLAAACGFLLLGAIVFGIYRLARRAFRQRQAT